MIERKDLYHVPFYKKSDFTGSYQGMRYRIGKVTLKEEKDGAEIERTILRVTAWPGPYAFDATADDKKESEEFEFSDDGITAACDWLNAHYSEKEDLYKRSHI